MAMYNELQIISVTGKENKIVVTRLSTVNRGQIRACGAFTAVAPKRTGSGWGIVTVISLW